MPRKASKSCCNKEPDSPDTAGSPESRSVELRDLPTSPRSSPAVLTNPRSPTERQSRSVSNLSVGSQSLRSLARRISMPRMRSVGSLRSPFSSTTRLPPLPTWALNAYMLETNLLISINSTELAALTRGFNDEEATCKICQRRIDAMTDKFAVHNAAGCGAAYHDECLQPWVIKEFYNPRSEIWSKPYCRNCQGMLEVEVKDDAWRRFGLRP